MPRKKRESTTINDDGFDLECAHDEWQALCLWDALPDCLKTRQVINDVLRLVQSSPELLLLMNLRRPENG